MMMRAPRAYVKYDQAQSMQTDLEQKQKDLPKQQKALEQQQQELESEQTRLQEQQASLERKYMLSNPQAPLNGSLAYDLLDTTHDNIAALLKDPAVADTNDIDDEWARVRLGIVPPNDNGCSAIVADLRALIARAERLGLRAVRAARWRERLAVGDIPDDTLLRCERRLRLWVHARVGRHG